MSAFPTIQIPDYPMGEDTYVPQVRTEFDSGYVQSKARFTRSRKVFTLNWKAMTAANFATLDAFLVANAGIAFTWTHPLTAVAYSVRHRDDSLKSQVVRRDRRQISIVLEEV